MVMSDGPILFICFDVYLPANIIHINSHLKRSRAKLERIDRYRTANRYWLPVAKPLHSHRWAGPKIPSAASVRGMAGFEMRRQQKLWCINVDRCTEDDLGQLPQSKDSKWNRKSGTHEWFILHHQFHLTEGQICGDVNEAQLRNVLRAMQFGSPCD